MSISEKTLIQVPGRVIGPNGLTFTMQLTVTELRRGIHRTYVFPFAFDESGLHLPDGNYEATFPGGRIKAMRISGQFVRQRS